jgi:hypothetical protein
MQPAHQHGDKTLRFDCAADRENYERNVRNASPSKENEPHRSGAMSAIVGSLEMDAGPELYASAYRIKARQFEPRIQLQGLVDFAREFQLRELRIRFHG